MRSEAARAPRISADGQSPLPALQAGIYTGEVIHQRFVPKAHRLTYRIFQLLIDLDQPKETLFFSHNRFNLFSFHDCDHGPDKAQARTAPLRDRMIRLLSRHGLYTHGDRLFLMAMPRVLGFVFNPISLYFLQSADGVMKAVVYEVNNTFGDRHSYVLPVRQSGKRIHQASEKRLHVSPFMDMDMAYSFDLIVPDETFALKIDLKKGDQQVLFAGFTAIRKPLRDRTLLYLFFAMPLMTLGVVWGIHWEALLLFLKGIRLRPKPPTEKSSVSLSA
ncbi:DUF1365 domain-containing protein [Asticcacaulis sp.]|uniref:DUF1365 domain-containing protein n=1 Tax=Asticcacaulis sp. TaxID=1872648 RepID=UPI003F7B86FE